MIPTPTCAGLDGGSHVRAKARAALAWPTPNSRDAKPGTARPHGGGRKGQTPQTNLNDLVLRWPTPTVHGNGNYKGASAKSGDGLMTVVKRREGYPTPQARDCHSWTAHPHGWAKKGTGAQHNLNDFVLRWPTPCAADYKGLGKTPRDRLDYAVNGETKSAVYPTPRTLSLCGGSGAYQQIKNNPNLTDDEKRALIASAGRGANKYNTPTVHGDGGSGRNGAMPKYGQLNPDWEEWLMAWPVGWTDIETPNIRLVWLDPSIDPADYGEIPRITNRRDNRPARVREIGNGQFPLTTTVAFHWGLCVLAAFKD